LEADAKLSSSRYGFDIDVASTGGKTGNRSSIVVNGIELSPNQPGANVVRIGPQGVSWVGVFDPKGDPHINRLVERRGVQRSAFSLAEGDANGLKLPTGWSDPEKTGRWSSAKLSVLVVPITIQEDKNVAVELDGFAFVSEQHPEQIMKVFVGGRLVDTWVVKFPTTEVNRLIPVPSDLRGADQNIRVELQFPLAASPSELGQSTDTRTLALFLREIRVRELP
jgi:hypothetical protein